MTDFVSRKLYWADAYRTRFTARVLHRSDSPNPTVTLNRTLFYPEGGGQPHDTGHLGVARVIGVEAMDGSIRHHLDRPLSDTSEISGEIDWPRRWDHMQQHSGQHLLSAAFLDLLERPTIGFHLSAESVTIDIPGLPPDPADIARALAFTQAVIAADLPIRSYQVDPADIASIPLRKPPTVDGPVRVVEIAGTDWSACGGTHVRSTAAIGQISIPRLERRGNDTRVHFLCGERAVADYQQRLAVTQTLTAKLTTGVDELPAAIERMQAQIGESQKSLREATTKLASFEAEQLLAASASANGLRVVRHHLPNADADTMGGLMRALLAHERVVAMLSLSGTRPRWAIGCSSDVAFDLQAILPNIRAIPGIQGGGSSDLLQGAAADEAALASLTDLFQFSTFNLSSCTN